MKTRESAARQKVDLVLKGGTAITVDQDRRVIRDAGIAIQAENIMFVGKATEVSERYEAGTTLNCDGKVVIPGMINAHIHYSHHPDRSLIPDTFGPATWSSFVHTNVSPYLTAKDEIAGTKALLVEMLKGGTTAFLEAGSFHPFETIQCGIQSIGIKGMMGRRAFDRPLSGDPTSLVDSADDILKIQERFLNEFGNKNLPIQPIVTIAGMGRFTDRLVVESKKLADRYGVLLKMHLAAWPDTVSDTKKQTGLRPVEHLEKLGVLDKNVVLVHMVYVNQKEVDILAKRGVKVVHCPSAGLKVAYAWCFGRFPEMLDAGIPVAIGSDASSGSNYNDMIRVMNLAAVLYKGLRYDPEAMGAERAIEMATINGAKTMGMEREIGSLELGKKADIVILDSSRLDWHPLYNEVQALVHSANADHVESVIINGKLVVDKRKVLTVNEEKIMTELYEMERDIKTRLKVGIISPWKFI